MSRSSSTTAMEGGADDAHIKNTIYTKHGGATDSNYGGKRGSSGESGGGGRARRRARKDYGKEDRSHGSVKHLVVVPLICWVHFVLVDRL